MENGQSPKRSQRMPDLQGRLRVLLVTEGSGGHLIPALETANALARGGARTTLWYAQRARVAPLTTALLRDTLDPAVEVQALPVATGPNWLGRLRCCGQLWLQSHRAFGVSRPDVVVGFGGWVSAPVVLAAKQRGIASLLHEQNVELGRANRLLARRVNQVLVSFEQTRYALNHMPSVRTGLPVRSAFGGRSRHEAAARFQFDALRPTVLILGGSQGARAINRLLTRTLPVMTPKERRTWQMIHLTGAEEETAVKAAYGAQGIRAHVAAFLADMASAYAMADVVVARAGASTIAELARCGLPAVLIPYPLAHGHQRANARLVEAVGGGIVLEEAEVTPERLLEAVRLLLNDQSHHERMARCIRGLDVPDAAARLAGAIADVGAGKA